MKSGGVTIKEIAKSLGMSGTTVSRVLSGNADKYRISKNTQKRVQEAAVKFDFAPNQIAQNLRLKRSNTIGLVIPDISNPFFANLARTVETEMRKRGKLILLGDTNDDTSLETEILTSLSGRMIDGLLIAPVGLESEHFEKVSHIPMVMIDRYFEESSFPYVSANNYLGAYQATQYLIEKKHRNIVCVQGAINTVSNSQRVAGFQKALQDSHFSNSEIDIIGSTFSIQNGYDAVQILRQRKDFPTAIFTLNNQIAIGVLTALKEAHLSVPEKVSLISFDEQPYFELTSPAITTIKQPIEQVSQEAVRMLIALMDGNEVKNSLIAPTIIERDSVKYLT